MNIATWQLGNLAPHGLSPEHIWDRYRCLQAADIPKFAIRKVAILGNQTWRSTKSSMMLTYRCVFFLLGISSTCSSDEPWSWGARDRSQNLGEGDLVSSGASNTQRNVGRTDSWFMTAWPYAKAVELAASVSTWCGWPILADLFTCARHDHSPSCLMVSPCNTLKSCFIITLLYSQS